jgi:thiol-disulfide isomerase/thioredoxin
MYVPSANPCAFQMLMYLQCIVANIDADAEPNRPLAQQYGVQSFPTIKFFPKGGDPIEYEGGRQEADFVRFLNEKCGTHRAVGGGLNDEVGVCGTFFEFRVTMIRRAVTPSSTSWPASSSPLVALRAMQFTKKHPYLPQKSVPLPLTISG